MIKLHALVRGEPTGILRPEWTSTRDGFTLTQLLDKGEIFVIYDGESISFIDGVFDEVWTIGSPIGGWNPVYGPGISELEIRRVLKPDGIWRNQLDPPKSGSEK